MKQRMRNFDDLIWEVVRRNEIYISEYKSLNNNENGIKIAHPGFNYKWMMKKAFDPEMSIDDIAEKIEKGSLPIEIHPYWQFYNNKSDPANKVKVPALNYLDLKRLIRHDKSIFDDHEWIMEWLYELAVNNANRMLVSVDPYASDDQLAKNVASLKRDFLESPGMYVVTRDSKFAKMTGVNSNKDDGNAEKYHLFGEPTCSFKARDESKIFEIQSSKLEFFFECLARYDQVVDTVRKSYKCNDIKDGYVELPEGFKFKDAIPKYEFISKLRVAEKRKGAKSDPAVRVEDNLGKQYKKGYEETVNMIKASPAHIRFLREDR